MPANNRSRQSQRLDRLMRDPNGPRMKRIDALVSNNTWEMFVSLRDSANFTQREALEFALQLAVVLQTLRGRIAEERLTDLCFAAMAESKRARKNGKDPEAGEPEHVE